MRGGIPELFNAREYAIFEGDYNPCGSELARDSGVSDNKNVECQTAIASKLAPTVLNRLDQCFCLSLPADKSCK
jgi:hypothetical protein